VGGDRLRQGLGDGPSRLQQAPLWHYINTCQYRYDGQFSKYNAVPKNEWTKLHTADTIFQSVRMGWMPFYPQFAQNPLELAKEAQEKGGAKTDDDIKQVRAREAEEQRARVLDQRPRRPRRTTRASGTSGAATPSWAA
jgi:nitrate reductase alpha subunit